ncbi:DPY30 domain-containing protein 2 [Sciurus carolinensis]|uniref:DPY30 domain-containing protein 2 n=1 Tax=Sciurus carolinensis TaxID=30640 RepID=A0AA41SSD6_SCICA|nr:DPY30 domain-containing protein 2 [Sciurus carolinensis]XP_047409980.1 DPY30 domain-containing protein 2-like [Sciurus carolinensis]MBZ3872009.1 DPY30 domain-containing protein 2 [Sciurus carolinensis]
METEYLKKCFGNSLSKALAEVASVRPSDPIEYLARWLYHYRKIAIADEKNRQEQIQLKKEVDNSLQEMEMAQMMKEEELQIQQKYEECHKEVISPTVSKKKVIFMQEDPEIVEEEALEEEPLPDTDSMSPSVPQQSPPPELAYYSDLNLDSP